MLLFCRCRRELDLWRKEREQKQLDIEPRKHAGSLELSAPSVTLTESALTHHPTSANDDQALTVTSEQVSTVNNEQTASVTDEQVSAVNNEQTASVTDEQVSAVNNEQTASVTDEQVSAVNNEQTASVTDEQVSAVNNEQTASVTDEQAISVTGERAISVTSELVETTVTMTESGTGMCDSSAHMIMSTGEPSVNTQFSYTADAPDIAANSISCDKINTTDTADTTNTVDTTSTINTTDTVDTTNTINTTDTVDTTDTADTGSTDVAATSLVSSPGKFTVTRRIQSALKLREKTNSLEDEPLQGRWSSDSGIAVTNPVGTARHCASPESDKAKTSTSVYSNLSEVQRQETSEAKERTRAEKTIKEKERCRSEHNLDPNKVGTTADSLPKMRSVQEIYSRVSTSRKLPNESFEDEEGEGVDEFLREQRALTALVESREREELVAQLSRERMNKMVTAEELAQVCGTASVQGSHIPTCHVGLWNKFIGDNQLL